jgi:stage II sporulation protein D
MKKLILILTVILFLPIYSNANSEYIKIGLKYSNNAILECSLMSSSGFILNIDEKTKLEITEKSLTIKLNSKFNIEILNLENNKIIYTHINNSFIELLPLDMGTILFNNTEYRGSLRFFVSENKITVINYILIEDYLKSVVPSEIVATWNFEALKAQAICARNYAITNSGRFEKFGFDLDDTINSQVYKGVKSEHPNTTRAVEETKGQLLKFNDTTAKTLFFSSSGGHTESVNFVWGSQFPYLVGVKDPYEEPREWKVNYTPKEISEKLNLQKIDIGNIIDLEIIERSPSNRVINLLIKGKKGTHTLKLEAPRSFLNLKSNLYDIVKNYSSTNLVDIITKSGIEKRQVSGKIITKSGILELSNCEISSFDFVGKGSGHGVGMSQYGAKGLAENGYTYDQILKYYFTGTYIQNTIQ